MVSRSFGIFSNVGSIIAGFVAAVFFIKLDVFILANFGRLGIETGNGKADMMACFVFEVSLQACFGNLDAVVVIFTRFFS